MCPLLKGLALEPIEMDDIVPLLTINKHFESSCELLRFDAFALPELAAFVASSNLFIIQV